MELDEIREVLRSVPLVVDGEAAGGEETADLLGAAAEFAKVLRRSGVQQLRDSRELVATLQEPLAKVEEVRAAWQREQQRAVESERQRKELAKVVIGALDILDRLLAAFQSISGMEDWAEQTENAIRSCLRQADKVGLVALAAPGEPFDESVHDANQRLGGRRRGDLRIKAVPVRGYALNGQVLRRATVDVAD
jgi:molecular chaperone GrpE (heat shock protein)